jgi:hypothetical protein
VRMARWASPAPNPTATRPQRAICGSIPRAEEVDEYQGPIAIYCNVLQYYQLSFIVWALIWKQQFMSVPNFFQHVDVAWREVIRRCLIPKLDGIGATRCPLQLESALKRSGWGVNFPCHGEKDIAKSRCSVNNF